MMTLIGLAISIASLYSTAVVLGIEGDLLYWELSTLVGIILSPAVGAILMSLSTVIVAINARLLTLK